MKYATIKKVLDVCFALFLFVVLSPLIGLISLLIAASRTGPVFFLQRRPGKDGKIFTIYKFRTMIESTEKDGAELSDFERLTKLGKFLRAASLDELPQLINVIKGEMSFIGPRPLLCEYLELYTPMQMRRHEVLPGITGHAQTNGRNVTTWEERFGYDVYYVDHMSFLFDLKIAVKTVLYALKRQGINSEEGVTMKPFQGSVEE